MNTFLNKQKLLFSLISVCFFSVYLKAQTPTLDYFKETINDSAKVNSMIYSADGNIIIAGQFNSNKFQYGTNQFQNVDQSNLENSNDFFIAKLDAKNGNFIWATGGGAKNLNAPPNSSGKDDVISKICQDSKGYLYAIGTHEGEMEFQGDIIDHNNDIDKDIFIIKLSPLGKRVWTIAIMSPWEIGSNEIVADAICNDLGQLILGINTMGGGCSIYKFSSDGYLLSEASIGGGCNGSITECKSISKFSNSDIIVGTNTSSNCDKIRFNDSIIYTNRTIGIFRLTKDLKCKSVFFADGGLNVIRTNSKNQMWLSFTKEITNTERVQGFSLYDSLGNISYSKELKNGGTSVIDIYVDPQGNFIIGGNYSSYGNNSPLKFDNFTINHNNLNRGYNTYFTKFNNYKKTFDWVISVDGFANELGSFLVNGPNQELYTAITNYLAIPKTPYNVFFNNSTTNLYLRGLYVGKIDLKSAQDYQISKTNNNVHFFPNPCNEYIETNQRFDPTTVFSIYNTNGCLISSTIGESHLSTTNLNPGLYIIKITSPNINLSSHFIKQ